MIGREKSLGRSLLLAAPYAWLTLFFAAPFLIVVKLALSHAATAQPPYEPTFDLARGFGGFVEGLRALSFESFTVIFDDTIYLDAFLGSLRLAGLATALALVVAYPMALAVARAPQRYRAMLIVLAVAPFWTSFLIRVYAWMAILKDEGLLNHALLSLGVIATPLTIFATDTAVLIGIVYSYLPFMVLPIFNALERQDGALVEAAMDLGATPTGAFWSVTFPLSLPGVAAGALLVFIPAMGEFVIPDLLGGADTLMIGRTVWNEFFANRDWPVAAAAALLLLGLLLGPLVWFGRAQARGEAA